MEKRPEVVVLERQIEWRVAARRSTLQAQPEGWAKTLNGAWEKLRALARALVEHPLPAPSGAALRAACGRLSRSARLHIIKNIFRHRKVRYRGLEKNTGQLRVLFALANLYLVRRQFTRAAALCAG